MKRLVPALTALFLATVLPASLSAQSLYLVRKAQVYLQTGASTVSPRVYPFDLSFQTASANRVSSSVSSAAIPADSSGKGNLEIAYHSQGEMDTAYPNGAFTFAGPPSYSVSESGDLYPSAVPQVTGGSGTWTNGVLVVDPTQDTVLQFSNFNTYGSGAGSHEQFKFQAQDNSGGGGTQDVVSVPIGPFTVTAQPFTSYTITKNTLRVGTIYQCTLYYDAVSSVDSNSAPGALLLGLYTKVTQFYMVCKSSATPTPITLNPLVNVTGIAGSTLNIPVSGSGINSGTSIPMWYHNGAQVDFSNQQKYSVLNGSGIVIFNYSAADSGSYYVVVAGPGGVVTSNEITASLGVAPPPVTVPVITAQPAPANVASGTVAFNVTATGTGLAYQWYKNGTLLGGATSSRLLLQNVTGLDIAAYSCAISNSAGSVTSIPARLSVVSPDPNTTGRLINESVLTNVATGGSVTVGFTVGGQNLSASAAQNLLVRGVGPTLGQLGVPGTMLDPNLKVIPLGSQVAVTSNDNWGSNSAQVIAADNATGAFPLSSGSLDAALVSTFAPHGYSAIVNPNTAGGSVIAEIYDNTPAGTYTASSPRLVNLSVIAPLASGGSLSAGFVIGGTTSRTVLIRAMGPALSAFGLPGLPDPKLSLVLQSSGTLVASNQVWGGDPQMAAIANAVGGFAFASPTSLDSAMLVTVSPGITYTATATSASGAVGQVLIEVYEVP